LRHGPSRPWWSPLLPGPAEWTIRSDLRDRLGPAIREVVEFYDQRLQTWLKAGLDRLVERYETQAGPVREQVRHPTVENDELETKGDPDQLEADLRELSQPEIIETK
jgi:hypothetical protein